MYGVTVPSDLVKYSQINRIVDTKNVDTPFKTTMILLDKFNISAVFTRQSLVG